MTKVLPTALMLLLLSGCKGGGPGAAATPEPSEQGRGLRNPCVDLVPGSYSYSSPEEVQNNCPGRRTAKLVKNRCGGGPPSTDTLDVAISGNAQASPGAFECGWTVVSDHP